MDFHIRLNKKAQLNLGFVVSVMLLVFLIFIVIFSVLRSTPALSDEIEQNSLRARAHDLNILLFEDPVVGLAKTGASGNVIIGELDYSKITSMSGYEYSITKTILNADVDFTIRIKQGTATLLNYKPAQVAVPTSENVVVINRFMVVNSSAVNVTLTVW